MSRKLTPAASTSTSSCPRPGWGSGTSWSSSTSGPPVLVTTIARMRGSLTRGRDADRIPRIAEVTGDQQAAVGAQLGGRALEHDLAVGEHAAAVGHLERELDVLLDQQHAGAGLLGVA